MTKIKLCGLTESRDIETANLLLPEYIGFVFAKKSRRYVSFEKAAALKKLLHPAITPVGVFVNEPVNTVAALLNRGTIQMAQLHGNEDEAYIHRLRTLCHHPIMQAFVIHNRQDLAKAQSSSADYVLLDAGRGTGFSFDWQLLDGMQRPYFLAGGLNPCNVESAVRTLNPHAVDVSSGIETARQKDPEKMAAFVQAVRNTAVKAR